MKPDILLLPGFMLNAGLWDDMLHPGNGLAQLGHLHFGDLGQDDSIEKMALRVLETAPDAQTQDPLSIIFLWNSISVLLVLQQEIQPSEISVKRDS